MESLRDVKRVMEREIEKGSCPLQFEYLEFGEKPFQFIESEEKLNEVLSYLLRLGEYRGYTEHLVGNNVYMDLDMLCRKIQFKRTHSPVERSEIQWKIQRYKNKLKPDYAGKVCLEIVQCVFSLPEGAARSTRLYMMDRKPMLLPCQISIFWDFLLIVKPQENLLWRTVWSLYICRRMNRKSSVLKM